MGCRPQGPVRLQAPGHPPKGPKGLLVPGPRGAQAPEGTQGRSGPGGLRAHTACQSKGPGTLRAPQGMLVQGPKEPSKDQRTQMPKDPSTVPAQDHCYLFSKQGPLG